MPKFNKGDQVIVHEPSYGPRRPSRVTPGTVVKQGVKYVRVQLDDSDPHPDRLLHIPFDKEIGRMKTDPSRNSHYDPSIWVPADWEVKQRRAAAFEALHEVGLSFGLLVRGSISTEKVEKLVAVMREED